MGGAENAAKAGLALLAVGPGLFLALMCAKIDGNEDWPWSAVFVPVWLAACSGFMFAPIFADRHLGAFLWINLISFLILLFTVLLALRLDRVIPQTVNWAWIFTPLWIGLVALTFVDRVCICILNDASGPPLAPPNFGFALTRDGFLEFDRNGPLRPTSFTSTGKTPAGSSGCTKRFCLGTL
jgi:hypothetical protein